MLFFYFFFFFNDTATTEIYTLSLHDALPILAACGASREAHRQGVATAWHPRARRRRGAASRCSGTPEECARARGGSDRRPRRRRDAARGRAADARPRPDPRREHGRAGFSHRGGRARSHGHAAARARGPV